VPEQRADSLAVAAAKLTGQVTELLAVVGTLKERLTEVEEDQGGTNRRVKRNESKANFLRALLVFDIAMTLFVTLLYWREFQTNRQLDATQSKVLCPLYSIFLGAYNPDTRPAGQPRQTYEDDYVIIREGYRILACTTPIVPPAIPHAAPPSAPPSPTPGN